MNKNDIRIYIEHVIEKNDGKATSKVLDTIIDVGESLHKQVAFIIDNRQITAVYMNDEEVYRGFYDNLYVRPYGEGR